MMNRRTFVQSTGLLSTAAILPLSSCDMSINMGSKYKMGYQLFSVNDDMKRDPFGTLTALKGMGYEDFEIYGFDPELISYYGVSAKEFKNKLDDLGLTVTSGHYGFASFLNQSEEELEKFVDQCIEGAIALQSPYITWPWIAPEQRTIENFKLMSQKLNVIGEQINKAGLGFAYHNHGFEFEDHNGEIGFDIIIKETEPTLVKLQMDMYWVMHSANVTPKEIVEQNPGRVVMWHIKDMDRVTRDYTELGNGSIDYTSILPDPNLSGLQYYYLEQGGNFAKNSMQSAEDSAKFFKVNIQKLI